MAERVETRKHAKLTTHAFFLSAQTFQYYPTSCFKAVRAVPLLRVVAIPFHYCMSLPLSFSFIEVILASWLMPLSRPYS